jgi:hypothetical protein
MWLEIVAAGMSGGAGLLMVAMAIDILGGGKALANIARAMHGEDSAE